MMVTSLVNQSALGNITNFSYFMLYLMTTPPFLIPTKSRIPEMHGVLGQSVVLPCGNTASESENSVRLILWYKGNSKTPFYTIDARKVGLKRAKHFNSEGLDKRFNIDLIKAPFELSIESVVLSDEGIYRCRIEQESSPTESYLVRLSVIVPPNRIEILNGSGEEISGLIGPYDEDVNITLTCLSYGGNPPPIVTWWRGSSLVDKSLSATQDAVTNELSLALSREDWMSTYTCITSNTNRTIPLAKSVTIDMNLKPLGVAITTRQSPLRSGVKVTTSCRSWGSQPPSLLSWWLNGEKVHSGNESFTENISLSTITISPNPEDNGRTLACLAEHPSMANVTIQYGWTLVVYYIPKLTATLGRAFQKDNLVEGMDVYFECNVDSNPPVEEVMWFFGRKQLYSNVSGGIIVSNRSLVLRGLRRSLSGRYQCSGQNEIGEGWSDPLFIHVKYAPECCTTFQRVMLLAPGETTSISCDAHSNPEPNIFFWSWDHSGDIVNLQTVNSNQINYNSSQGYGVLNCWSSNSIGVQAKPCQILILRKDHRNLRNHCNITTVSNSSLLINCANLTSEDDKLIFHLEVYSSETSEMITNRTSSKPEFLLVDVQSLSEISLVLYASSARGRTEAIKLDQNPYHHPQSSNATTDQIAHDTNDTLMDLRPLFITLISSLILLILVGISAAMMKKSHNLKVQRKSVIEKRRENEAITLEDSSVLNHQKIRIKRTSYCDEGTVMESKELNYKRTRC